MDRRRPLCLALSLLAFALPVSAQPQEAASRALVLDTEGRAVVALDVTNGVVMGKAPLEGAPAFMIRNRDLSRLVVFDEAPGKQTVRFGFHPTGKTPVTILDGATLEVLGRVEVGYNAGYSTAAALFSPDGRKLAILCGGYRSQKAQETLPAEVVTLSLDRGQIVGRAALSRPVTGLVALDEGQWAVAFAAAEEPRKGAAATVAEAFFVDLATPAVAARVTLKGAPLGPLVSPDRASVAFFSPRLTPKKLPAVPATLQVVDVASRQVAADLTLEGNPEEVAFAHDGRHYYLLERGRFSKKPEESIQGRVQVVSMETRAHETNLPAGTNPQAFIPDPEGGQILLLSDGPPSKETGRPQGELRVIRGPEIAAVVKVASSPNFIRLSPDRQRLYVVGDHALTHVDFASLRPFTDTPLRAAGVNILSADEQKHLVSDLAFSADGRRGFALYAGSSRLSVLDLEDRKFVASVTTGRGGVKFGKFMGALALSVAMTTASQSMGRSNAIASGSAFFLYPVYNYQIRAPNTSLAVRPDGKFAYALNTQTSDVTIVDADLGTVVDKVPAAGRSVRMFTGGSTLAVSGQQTLHLIDTATNKKREELAFPGAGGVFFVLSKDGRHAVAAGGSILYFMDGVTGKVRSRSTAVKKAYQVMVEDAEEDVPIE